MHENENERRNEEADEAWSDYQRTGQFVSNDAMTAWLNTWGTGQGELEPLLLEALKGGGSQEIASEFFERLCERARQAIKAKERGMP